MSAGKPPPPAATLETERVRVVFERRGDRFFHRVETRPDAGADWRAALESHEGAADEPWPASPPLQQLHVEERPTGRVVLLVGMAGRAHWSAAVERASDGSGIRFDVAVRYQNAPAALGSAYARTADGGPLPTIRAELPSEVTTRETRPAAPLAAATGMLRVRPAIPLPAAPATVAWRYTITMPRVGAT